MRLVGRADPARNGDGRIGGFRSFVIPGLRSIERRGHQHFRVSRT